MSNEPRAKTLCIKEVFLTINCTFSVNFEISTIFVNEIFRLIQFSKKLISKNTRFLLTLDYIYHLILLIYEINLKYLFSFIRLL